MHKTIRYRARTLVASVAATTLLLAATSAARSEENAGINEMIFEVNALYGKGTISVASSNGQKWDTILTDELQISAQMKVDTKWPGYVERVGLYIGSCVPPLCGNGYPMVYFEHPNIRDYNEIKEVKFAANKIPVSSATGIAVASAGDAILAKCNEKLQPDGATKAHSFNVAVPMTLSVNTREHGGWGYIEPPHVYPNGWPRFNGGDQTRYSAFAARVNCLATSPATANPNPDPHRTKVTATSIELFLATLVQPASAGHGPSGTQCKPIKVTTRIETDKAGPQNVKLWRQVDNGPITSEAKQMHASALAGGKFGDDWVKWENFTKTTTVQYKAEVLGGTFAPSTPWKSITVHCNGNFASPTSDANPDNRNPGKGKPVAEPRVPTIVTPPPRLVCVGGKVAGGTCVCPRTHTLLKQSSAAFQCVKVAVAPDTRAPLARPPRVDSAPAYLVGPNRPGGMRPGAPMARRISAMPPRLYFR